VTRTGRIAALLACGAVLGGCSVGRAMIAPSGDYAAYRRYRVSNTLDERLSAAWDYLQERPDGTYAASLRAWFDGAEPVFYAVRRRSMAGLEAYLQALPEGPHATDVLDELMRRRLKSRRDEARMAAAEVTSQRLDQERARREAVADLPVHWSEMLIDPAAWSVPLDRAPRDLLLAYSLELPHAECHRDDDAKVQRCSKAIDVGFPVVEQGEVQDRRLLMWVELELDDAWQLHAARLFGPALFVHLVEARDKHLVAAGDQAAREAALESLEERLLDRLRRPGNGCEVVLGEDWSLRCPERRLVVHRGTGDEDDTITIEPVR
jgi:hypothetical protein